MRLRPTELIGLAAGFAVWTGALLGFQSGSDRRPAPTAAVTTRPTDALVMVSAPADLPGTYRDSPRVRGRVVDVAGHPVAGSVVIVCPFSLIMPPLPYGFVTDDNGRFEVAGLAPGRYSFVAIHGQYPPGAIDSVPVFDDERGPRLSSVEVEIVLDRDLVIEA